MLHYLLKLKFKRFVFNVLFPLIALSLFSSATEAGRCRKGFVEKPGSVLNRFKSLIHIRSLGARSETEKIKALIPELRPKEIMELKKRDIEALGRKGLFRLFSLRQLVLFSEIQQSWSPELRRNFERAEEIVKKQDEDPAYQILLRSKSESSGFGPFNVQ